MTRPLRNETATSVLPRIILNHDGFNFLNAWDDLGADDLRAYLHRLKDTHVDVVAYVVAAGGWLTLYDSELGEPLGTGFGVSDRVRVKRFLHNRRQLEKDGSDYIGNVFAILNELSIKATASIRMNDAHMSNAPVSYCSGRFWMNHPEWRLGEPYGYYGACLNYAVPAVRTMLRRLVREIIDRYPGIAGIELDGMRSPFFFEPAEARGSAPVLTNLFRQIRQDLDEPARTHGKERYILRVNVPRSLGLCEQVGLDVSAWDSDRLVDGIAAGCYGTDFQIPIAEWKSRLKHTLVYAYVIGFAALKGVCW